MMRIFSKERKILNRETESGEGTSVLVESFEHFLAAQFADCLSLYLPDAFARDAEKFSGLFQRQRSLFRKSEPQLDYFHFTVGQLAQHVVHRFLKRRRKHELERLDQRIVADEVRKPRIVVVIDGSIEAGRFLGQGS